MKTNILIEMAEIYAQARANRTKREHFRVLLGVEDEFTYKQLLSLLPTDAEVTLIGEGESLLEAYLGTAPDLLILDPEVDVHQQLEQIYEVDSDHFVALLADDMSQKEIMDALETGAQGFLTKPYTQRKMSHYLELLRTAKAHRAESTHTSAIMH